MNADVKKHGTLVLKTTSGGARDSVVSLRFSMGDDLFRLIAKRVPKSRIAAFWCSSSIILYPISGRNVQRLLASGTDYIQFNCVCQQEHSNVLHEGLRDLVSEFDVYTFAIALPSEDVTSFLESCGASHVGK